MTGGETFDEMIEDWLSRAAEDLLVAQLLLPHGLYNSVAYHSQQVAEKALKALLISLDQQPRKTHELDLLLDAARAQGIGFDEAVDDAAFGLAPFATISRYPGWGQVSHAQAEQALVWARVIDSSARAKIEQRPATPER